MTVDKFGHFSTNRKKLYNRNQNNHKRQSSQRSLLFAVDLDGCLNLKNNRLRNIADPVGERDAIPKSFLQKEINEITQELLSIVEHKNSKINLEINNLKKFIDGHRVSSIKEHTRINKDIEIGLASIKKYIDDKLEILQTRLVTNE